MLRKVLRAAPVVFELVRKRPTGVMKCGACDAAQNRVERPGRWVLKTGAGGAQRACRRTRAAREYHHQIYLRGSRADLHMAPTKKPQKAAKKEKVFHPESRKAGQLARKQLRKSKLAGQASKRTKLHSAKGKSLPCLNS